tara:strand:+ start:201 stop:500 length:300 start_codon:yes stop_codon:yes gene_type:complete
VVVEVEQLLLVKAVWELVQELVMVELVQQLQFQDPQLHTLVVEVVEDQQTQLEQEALEEVVMVQIVVQQDLLEQPTQVVVVVVEVVKLVREEPVVQESL